MRKPSGGLPAAMDASFRSAMMPAKVGAEAEVPLINPLRFRNQIRKRVD